MVEVGAKVREFTSGDKVMCFGWNNNFAEYFKAKVWELQAAPVGLEMDLVSLGEPIACAMFSGLNSGNQYRRRGGGDGRGFCRSGDCPMREEAGRGDGDRGGCR